LVPIYNIILLVTPSKGPTYWQCPPLPLSLPS
jgi:hypothetical protein